MKCDYKYCIYNENKKCKYKQIKNKDIELRGTTCATCRIIVLQERYLTPQKNKRVKKSTQPKQ